MNIRIFLFLIIITTTLGLLGCSESEIQSRSESTATLSPSASPTLTPSPSPSATPTFTPTATLTPTATPSLLDNYAKVLAYSEKDKILLVNEYGKKITTVNADGWVSDFKFSPDGNKVIFTLFHRKDGDLGYFSYGLYMQTIGRSKNTIVVSPNDRIVFFEWLNDEEIIVVTLKQIFTWSIDGGKQHLADNPIVFENVSNTRFSAIGSPVDMQAVIVERYIQDRKIQKCSTYILDYDNGNIEIIAEKDGYCDAYWLPNGKYVRIQSQGTMLFDASEKVFVETSESVSARSWLPSPNEEYAVSSYMRVGYKQMWAFSVYQNKELFDFEEIFLHAADKPFWFEWSHDSQYLLAQDIGTFFIVRMDDMERIKSPYLDTTSKYRLVAWWSPIADEIFFTSFSTQNGKKVHSILWSTVGTRSSNFVTEFPELPGNSNWAEVYSSGDGLFTAISAISSSPESPSRAVFFTIIDNASKISTAQIYLEPDSQPAKFAWVK